MKSLLARRLLAGALTFLIMAVAYAGTPLWTFTSDPLFPPKISVSATGSATVKYTVTNQSKRRHTLVMQARKGIIPPQPCQLAPKGSANSSCTLDLTILGNALPSSGLSGGPVLCQANPNGTPNPNQCYRPTLANSLAITVNNNPSLVSIEVMPANSTIAKGTTQQFIAIGTYSDASIRNITTSVTWSSSNTTIATISNTAGVQGRAKGITAGIATIKATQGTVSGTTNLKVTNATLVSIAVTPTNPTIGVRTKIDFIATGTYSDSTTQNITNAVTWTSSNTSIATISNTIGSEGRAMGIAGGTTTIKAALGSVSGTTKLKVTNATLVSIAVTPTNPSIAAGVAVAFTATGTYSDATTQDLTNSVIWTSSNIATATISNAIGTHGRAHGIAPGTTTIKATFGSVAGITHLKVTNATLVSIAVTPTNPSIALGTSIPFIATGTYSDATTQNITSSVIWSSSNISTATISNAPGSQGWANSINVGTTTIKATLGSVAGSTNLNVTNATLVAIAITPTNPSIALGTTILFTATGTYSDATTQNITSSVNWSSSNTATATISNAIGNQGQATSIGVGNTSIKATLGSVSGTTNLKVTNASLVSIAVTPTNPSIALGSTVSFLATGTYSDATTQNITDSVTWTSSNTATAAISNATGNEGLATSIALGTTLIKATLGSVSGATNLNVTNATLVAIEVTPINPSIALGGTIPFIATGTYSDSTTQNITNSVIWTSSNTATATISNAYDSQGLATSLAVGTTTIQATLGSVSGASNLNVTNATLVSIAVTPTNPSIALGSTVSFIATGTYSDATTQTITDAVTWTSTNPNTATISNAPASQGLATSVAEGTTTIQATLGSVSGVSNLNVTNATLVAITVTPTNPSIALGTTIPFIATGTYSDFTTQLITDSVTWSSSNTATATISNATGSKGRATSIAEGATTIQAALGTVSGTTNLNVTTATLVAIEIIPIDTSIPAGGTIPFIAIGTYSDSTTQIITNSVTWSSSNTATARVSNAAGTKGQATGIAAGTTTIKATLGMVFGTTRLDVTTPTYTVGGSVSGLVGTVTLLNNGGDPLVINNNGTFTFTMPIAQGSSYSVTVQTQPATQTCVVTNGSGIIGSMNITSVQVSCTTNTYTVGGNVLGLVGSVTLLNNGGDALVIDSNGAFTFTTPIAQGSTYSVTVQTQPATQTCLISNGTGTMGNANVNNVTVTCTLNTYTVGGNLSALIQGQEVVLLNNGVDPLTVNTDGAFTFSSPLLPGTPYEVTIQNQPSMETCTVSNGSGIMGITNVTNVVVTCSVNSYTVGGTLSGLALSESVTLENNHGDPLFLNSDGTFTFSASVAEGSPYLVTVRTQPATQICSISNGSGTMGSNAVTNVTVSCATAYHTVGGTVSGLDPNNTMRLTNNGADEIFIPGNGPYTFQTPVAEGSTYLVKVATEPVDQFCRFQPFGVNSGTMGATDVTNVNVHCTNNPPTTLSVTPQAIIPVNVGSATITVTNTGDNIVNNVSAVLPTGWVSVQQDSSDCFIIAPNGGTCTLSFTASAPYATNGNIPIIGQNISNTPTTTIAFSIGNPNYLVYAVNSINTASVVDFSIVNEAVQFSNMGAALSSTSLTDGASNTESIINTPNVGETAAAVCNSHTINNAIGPWYLPAICQYGPPVGLAQCPSGISNIYSSLIQYGFTTSPSFNVYWSSTITNNPDAAWTQRTQPLAQMPVGVFVQNTFLCGALMAY